MMNANVLKVALVSSIMIMSSLAGCLSDDVVDEIDDIIGPIAEPEPIPEEPVIYGNVMVSTYHVGELVKAVGGENITVEYMNQDNIPVHDYEPTPADIIRLSESDLFFYHGLGLEPWVESTLSAMTNAPPSFMTHTMPTGETTLDYESLLVSNLCELMTDGPFESTTLGMMHNDHDDHSDEEDDHDEHNETDDDHDEEGEEITPETALEYFDINSDGSLSWDEFWVSWEEGEDDDHDEDNETDDDHGDNDGEHEEEMSVLMEIFNESDANMDDILDINELEHFIHEILELEEGHHEGHAHAEAEKTIQNPAGCPTDTVISIFHMEEGEYVLEFESEHDEDFNMAVLKMLGGHAHHDHHGHGDHDDHDGDDHDDHDDDMVCYDMSTHTVDSSITDQEDCETAGLMWAAANSGPGGDDDDHDDDHGDEMCHNTDTHENYESTEEECEAAGHMWTEGEDHDHDLPEIHADRVVHTLSFPEEDHEDDHSDEEGNHDDHSDEDEHHEMGVLVIHIEEEGDFGFALPSDMEMFIVMGEGGPDDHDDHDGDDHDDHDDDMVCYDMSTHTVDSSITDQEDCETAGLMWAAANSGPGGDDDDHDDDHSEEGESDIEAHEGEEAFDYDPHSWLDPLSFNAQLNLVLTKMTETFPDGADIFAENAAAYGIELTQLHVNFEGAFGDQGTCATSGANKTIVANHNAYSYISVRYGVDIMTVHGLDPEAEPSPAEVAEVVEHIKEEGITTLYVEEYTDQTAVRSIVEETGIDIQTLYTMELAPSDSNDDYLSMMNKNVQNMISGIGC